MNEEQYHRLYWKPLKKNHDGPDRVGVTPYIYTEGPYSSRLEQLTDVPKGKVLYHFEKVDMKEAKRILGGTACIMGNLPVALLEFGKRKRSLRKPGNCWRTACPAAATFLISTGHWKIPSRKIWTPCLRRWINTENIKYRSTSQAVAGARPSLCVAPAAVFTARIRPAGTCQTRKM